MSLTDRWASPRSGIGFYSRTAHHAGWDYDDYARVAEEEIDVDDIVWATHPWQTAPVLDVTERPARYWNIVAHPSWEDLHPIQPPKRSGPVIVDPTSVTRWSMATTHTPARFVYVCSPAPWDLLPRGRFRVVILIVTAERWLVAASTLQDGVMRKTGPA